MSLFKGELNRLRRLTRFGTVRRYLRTHRSPMLNVGCGPHVRAGWLNADKFNPAADIYLNAYDRFPFRGSTFDVVYSEHMLEHVVLEKVPVFLGEVFRVLKPEGVFRVTTPDLELFVRKYVEDDRAFFEPILRQFDKDRSRRPLRYWLVRGRGGVLMSRAVRPFFHHRWIYDFETLESCLREIGFARVVRKRFGESLAPAAGAMDRQERAFETLYVDAVK